MTKNKDLILGIDPGLNITGWGLIEKKGNFDNYLAHGFIKTDKKKELGFRLNTIYEKLLEITKKYSPSSIAIEKIFSNKNPESTLKLGMSRAIVFLIAARESSEIFEYSPNTVKKNLVGYGHADKNQIINMIKRVFPNINIDNEDSADALAVAICHSMQMQSKIRVFSK